MRFAALHFIARYQLKIGDPCVESARRAPPAVDSNLAHLSYIKWTRDNSF